MGQYYQQESGGFPWLFFLVFVVLIGGIVYAAFKFNLLSEDTIKNKLSTVNVPKATGKIIDSNIEIPNSNIEWCRVQQLTPRSNLFEEKIIGWDNINECCVYSSLGYDCVNSKFIALNYCFVGNIGAQIKYATADGYQITYDEMRNRQVVLKKTKESC